MQYTIRGVPDQVDRALRARAKKENKSLNQIAAEALAEAAGAHAQRYTDLDDLIGTWVDDPEFDQIMAEQDRIDEELWR